MGRNKRGLEKGKRVVALALTSVLLLASFDGSYSAVADNIFGSGPVDDVFGDDTSFNTEFTSDTAADPAQSQDEASAAEQAEVPSGSAAITYNDSSMNVTVTKKTEEIFPEGTQLSVVPVSGDDAEYTAVLEKLQAEAGTREHEVKSLWAYELSASDVQGAEIALGAVDVEVEYASPEAPEVFTEDTEVKIYTYFWDEEQNEAELFEVNADILLTDAKAVQTAKMQLDNPENIIFEWETKTAQETEQDTATEENSNMTDTDVEDGETFDEETSDEEISDEEISDEEISDEETSDEEISDEETSDEETSDEEIADEETSDEEISDEETSDEETSDEEIADEETSDEEISDEEISDEEISDEETSDEETSNKGTSEAGKKSRTFKEAAVETAVVKITAEETPVYAAAESETAEEAQPEVTEEEIPEATGEEIPEVTGEEIPEVTGEEIPEMTGEEIPEATGEEIPEATGEEIPEATGEEIPEVSEEEPEAAEESAEQDSEIVSTEVIGTAHAEDTFDLVETIKDEEGNPVWYGIVYNAEESVNGYVSADAAELVEEKEAVLEWSVQVGDAEIRVVAPEGAFDGEVKLQATEIKDEKELRKLEDAASDLYSEKSVVATYDITFFKEGEGEVQPQKPVQVFVNSPTINEVSNKTVLHFDEDYTAENMNGTTEEDGSVSFNTTSFSPYMVLSENSDPVVTINHYLYQGGQTGQVAESSLTDGTGLTDGAVLTDQADQATEKKKIYITNKVALGNNEKIDNCAKATNWNVKEVYIDGVIQDNPENAVKNVTATEDKLIDIYYEPKKSTPDVKVTFYDYTVRAIDKNNKVRSFNELADEDANRNPDAKVITAGSYKQNWINNTNEGKKFSFNAGTTSNSQLKLNLWTGNKESVGNGIDAKDDPTNGNVVVEGLLSGLGPDGSVKFNPAYKEPGFFVNEDAIFEKKGGGTGYLRQVIEDHKLVFNQSGDNWKLAAVMDEKDKIVQTIQAGGTNFYPLEKYSKEYELIRLKNDKTRKYFYEGDYNYFFGMRYDIDFTIGEYCGDLEYRFSGDDDFWVLLDKRVILDLGGLHNRAEARIDLWEKMGIEDPEKISEDDRKETHTLTILYMERGAGQSNCEMEFTIPNASFVQSQKIPKANLTFNKTDVSRNPLKDATFELYSDKECSNSLATATSNEDGEVTFSDLMLGNYWLKETSAPVGYLTRTDIWKVQVTLDSDGKPKATILENGVPTTSIQNEIIPWEIIKKSSSSDDKSEMYLKNAEFTLTEKTSGDVYYYGVSGLGANANSADKKSGKITWYSDNAHKNIVQDQKLRQGTYTLQETKAPDGYSISADTWEVTIGKSGELISFTGGSHEEEEGNTISIYIKNNPLYELPSTGGTGIYTFTIGGVLLMMAAALMLFQSRSRVTVKK